MDPCHLVEKPELDLALADRPGDRSGTHEIRGAGERNMPLSGKQARGRIQADPAGTWHKDLRPCVQIGEIPGRAGRAVE